MRRREFIALLGGAALAWPLAARAQVSPRRPLIAVIIGASQAASERWRGGLPQGMKERGRIQGRDYEIEYRYADGDLTRQPAIIDELIRRKPDLIVVGNSFAALAAKQATASIPIVFASSFDPVGLGLEVTIGRTDLQKANAWYLWSVVRHCAGRRGRDSSSVTNLGLAQPPLGCAFV